VICTYYAFVNSPPMPTGAVTENVFLALNDAVVILWSCCGAAFDPE
jgi:hypothetical protein